MKSRWLALMTLFLGTYAAIPAIAATNSVERHCIGLLWSPNGQPSTSTDGLLLLYSAEERGSYSRLAVRPPTPRRKMRHTICYAVAFFGLWGPIGAETTRSGPMSSPSTGTLNNRTRSGPSLSLSI